MTHKTRWVSSSGPSDAWWRAYRGMQRKLYKQGSRQCRTLCKMEIQHGSLPLIGSSKAVGRCPEVNKHLPQLDLRWDLSIDACTENKLLHCAQPTAFKLPSHTSSVDIVCVQRDLGPALAYWRGSHEILKAASALANCSVGTPLFSAASHRDLAWDTH